MKDKKKEKKKAAGLKEKEKEEKQKKAARKQKKHKKETSGEQRERKEIKEKAKQEETPAAPESKTEKRDGIPDENKGGRPGRIKKKGWPRAEIFRVLGDENRIQILELLREKDRCGLELLESLEIAQSTLSHHMKLLCEAGIVSCRKQGKRTYYCINRDEMEQTAGYLLSLTKEEKRREENQADPK